MGVQPEQSRSEKSTRSLDRQEALNGLLSGRVPDAATVPPPSEHRSAGLNTVVTSMGQPLPAVPSLPSVEECLDLVNSPSPKNARRAAEIINELVSRPVEGEKLSVPVELLFLAIGRGEPELALGPVCSYALCVADQNLVPVLEVIVGASRAVPMPLLSVDLSELAEGLWERAETGKVETLPSGVLSRCFELRVRNGEAATPLLDKLEVHPEGRNTLYLLSVKPASYLSDSERSDLYNRTVRLLRQSDQQQSLRKLKEVLGESFPD